MSFATPGWLALLGLIAALVVAYVVAQQRRPRYAARFTNLELLGVVLPRRPRWRRHVATGLLALGLTALVVALAQPVRTEEVDVARGTVMVAIDVSLSMDAGDVPPTRLEAAKRAAAEFLEGAPSEVALGLVTFAETAQVDVLPTTDRQPMRRAVEAMTLRAGTGIGEAIFASLDALITAGVLPPREQRPANGDAVPLPAPGDGERPPARIVVMSDGETTAGRPNEEAAAAAAAAGIPVWTIAFGTLGGTISYQDEVVPVPINGPALAQIASMTGGEHFEAATEAELFQVFENVGVTVDTETVERDLSPWFTGTGLALVVVAGLLSLVWFQRLV